MKTHKTYHSDSYTMDRLVRACRFALEHNLGLRAGESVLVVTDSEKRAIGTAFARGARTITPVVRVLEIPLARHNGQEPPAAAAREMRNADVVLLPTTKSLSWTKARRQATECGARIASMAGGLDADMILRLFEIDYRPIRQRVNKLCDLLDTAMRVRVTTASGTDLAFSVDGRQGRGRNGGIYTRAGAWGNLPCGEAFVAPVEGSAHGVYVVDASHAGVGALKTPIRIDVEAGLAVQISGGEDADQLKRLLAENDQPLAYNIAEFGIGCNPHARLSGATIEDEKSLGTCHIALGSNIYFGGCVDVGIHLDGIIACPTLYFDETKIMHQGKLLIGDC